MSGSGGNGHDYGPSSGSGGSGGGGGTGGGGGGGTGGERPDGDPCDIRETAPVNSPQPAVVRTLTIGDRLPLRVAGAPPRRILQLVAPAGVAGSLTHRSALALVNCIDAGHAYEAEVIAINAGLVTVRIERI